MRRRRAKDLRDTRPRWSDTDLKCIRDYQMANGVRMTEVDADYERRYREHLMSLPDQLSYKRDPTYNLRKK